jgi:hypothetical protein
VIRAAMFRNERVERIAQPMQQQSIVLSMGVLARIS